MPSLIAAGHLITENGTPIVRRLDLEFPQFPEAAADDQYLLTADLLVAPLGGGLGAPRDVNYSLNLTSTPPHGNDTRQVWIPPGQWVDAWTGEVVEGNGSQLIVVTRPSNRAALWHRRGGILVCVPHTNATPLQRQSWEHLILEVFPFPRSGQRQQAYRKVVQRQGSASVPHDLTLDDDGCGNVSVTISTSSLWCDTRTWTVRFHLLKSEAVRSVQTDPIGLARGTDTYKVLLPFNEVEKPLGGQGARPPKASGPIVELTLLPAENQACVQRRVVHLSYTLQGYSAMVDTNGD